MDLYSFYNNENLICLTKSKDQLFQKDMNFLYTEIDLIEVSLISDGKSNTLNNKDDSMKIHMKRGFDYVSALSLLTPKN